MKPNREIIINEILAEMDFGITRAEALAMNGEKWQLPTRTFDRQWKEASRRYLAANEREQKAKEVVRVQMAQELVKKAILSKHERMEILTQIARGEIPLTKHIVADGMIQEREVVPSWKDRRDAVAELNKMEGDYAPIKKDITSGGEPLKQITGIIVE
jgi:hypothetical protein